MGHDKREERDSDIVVGICYPPDQEDQADEALYRQIEATSHLQALVLMGDFSHTYICWKEHRMAGHSQFRRFLKYTDSNFLI